MQHYCLLLLGVLIFNLSIGQQSRDSLKKRIQMEIPVNKESQDKGIRVDLPVKTETQIKGSRDEAPAFPNVEKAPDKLIAFHTSSNRESWYTVSKESPEHGTPLELKTINFDDRNRIKGNSFIVPEDGVYHFNIKIEFEYDIYDYEKYHGFYLNLCSAPNTVLEKTEFKIKKNSLTPYYNMTLNTTIALTKGSVVFPAFKAIGPEATKPVSIVNVSFSGFKINK